MEYVNGISLREFYQRFKEKKISEDICKKIFFDICEAMSYLHTNHMAHRDIKLENILIDSKNEIKIIDFGFGMFSPGDDLQTFFCGTPNYMPPEIILKVNYKGDRADLWSLGILLYKMLIGEFPFKGESEKDLYKTIQKGKFKVPNFISEEAKQVLTSLIVLKPEKRYSCSNLLNFEWFKSLKKEEKIEEEKWKEENNKACYTKNENKKNEEIIKDKSLVMVKENLVDENIGKDKKKIEIINNEVKIIEKEIKELLLLKINSCIEEIDNTKKVKKAGDINE